jgi:cation transport regulator
MMPYENLEALPQDVQTKLPQEAQQIFMAAFNNATRDGLNEASAHDVAWNSVKNSYREGENGQWYHAPEGGTGQQSPQGTMPQS